MGFCPVGLKFLASSALFLSRTWRFNELSIFVLFKCSHMTLKTWDVTTSQYDVILPSDSQISSWIGAWSGKERSSRHLLSLLRWCLNDLMLFCSKSYVTTTYQNTEAAYSGSFSTQGIESQIHINRSIIRGGGSNICLNVTVRSCCDLKIVWNFIRASCHRDMKI